MVGLLSDLAGTAGVLAAGNGFTVLGARVLALGDTGDNNDAAVAERTGVDGAGVGLFCDTLAFLAFLDLAFSSSSDDGQGDTTASRPLLALISTFIGDTDGLLVAPNEGARFSV